MRRGRHDRHGRASRADNDRRRRPSDGFRAAHGTRFSDLVEDAIAELPGPLAEAVEDLEVLVEDVPAVACSDDEETLRLGEMPLARVIGAPPAGAGEPGLDAVDASEAAGRRLVVYRRPLELRAVSRVEIIEVMRVAIGEEVARVLGIDDDGLYDDY